MYSENFIRRLLLTAMFDLIPGEGSSKPIICASDPDIQIVENTGNSVPERVSRKRLLPMNCSSRARLVLDHSTNLVFTVFLSFYPFLGVVAYLYACK